MADEKTAPILSAKDVATTMTTAGMGVAQALAINPASAPSVLAISALLMAFMPTAVALMTEAGARRMKARGEQFYAKLIEELRDGVKTQEEVAAQLDSAKDDPKVSDSVWRAVRALMEAPNDAAAISLGVLAADYLRDRRPADRYFRGVVRLFADLDAAEVDELRKLLGWMIASTKRERVELIARHGTIDTARDEFAKDSDVDGMREKRLYWDGTSDPEQIFALLIANHLAVPTRVGRWGGDLPEIFVQRSTAESLLRLLNAY